jgi:pimeloyl-ACP methyl ester carboxylesterase
MNARSYALRFLPRRRRVWLALVLALSLAATVGLWLHPRLVAAGLFLRMEQARGVPGWLLHYGERAVDERLFARGAIQGILYTPRAGGTAPGLVLAHGIHDEGIHEARLVRLARSIASSGRVVFTPELTNLSHYRITHADAETIAQAARTLAEELGQARVAVFGISFGGGLALRAACEPALGQAIARVIALGAHHDAAQVARFFLGETARAPDGSTATLKPHGYGGTVLFAWLFGEKHRAASAPPTPHACARRSIRVRPIWQRPRRRTVAKRCACPYIWRTASRTTSFPTPKHWRMRRSLAGRHRLTR